MGPLHVPEALADLRVHTFKCLGSAMHFVAAAADYAEGADRVHVSPDAVTGALAPASRRWRTSRGPCTSSVPTG